MRSLIRRFLRDDSGSVVVGEWVFVATILVLGAVAGAAVLQPPASEDANDAPTAAAPAHPAASSNAP